MTRFFGALEQELAGEYTDWGTEITVANLNNIGFSAITDENFEYAIIALLYEVIGVMPPFEEIITSEEDAREFIIALDGYLENDLLTDESLFELKGIIDEINQALENGDWEDTRFDEVHDESVISDLQAAYLANQNNPLSPLVISRILINDMKR